MLSLILLLAIRFTSTNTCPILCQCYSAFDGYHITCQHARLNEIPLNLTRFLQTTNHQNLIVDLSSNFLSILPCDLFQISTIITLILTRNQIEYLPSCFSQSSIQNLRLNENHLQFNQTTILSSSKLLHLDLSHNRISQLPRTFFFHLRRLRTLVLNGENELFHQTNQQWIRSITTRNQLTIVICDENIDLPLCLFDSLFQSKKLFAIELHTTIPCDCSFVYIPLEKIHFQYCQSSYHQQQRESQGKCHVQSSRFEHGQSLIQLQTDKYRHLCAKEYQTCQEIQSTTRKSFHLSRSNNQSEGQQSFVKYSSSNAFTTAIVITGTSSKKGNITAGAIIPFVLLLLIVTIVCLYVVLSGHFFKTKNREKMTDFMIRRKKQHDGSSVVANVASEKTSTRIDEYIPIENINMNSNRQNCSLPTYHQRRSSYSDEESDLTFYSLNNDSSTSFIQSSMTEIEMSSTTNSSLSDETVIISHRNKQRIY